MSLVVLEVRTYHDWVVIANCQLQSTNQPRPRVAVLARAEAASAVGLPAFARRSCAMRFALTPNVADARRDMIAGTM